MTSGRYSEAWSFAQVDDFWRRYLPLTPWGKDERDERAVIADRATLEARYDDIEAAIAFLRSGRASAGGPSVGGTSVGGTSVGGTLAGGTLARDRVSYHLKRMPRLTLEAKDAYELLELFQIKKFIANYRGVLAALDGPTLEAFGLRPFAPGSAAGALASELDKGGSDPETFYLADSYDGGLAAARASVAGADAAISSARVKAEAEARLSFGVSFDGREFLVVPKDVARAMLAPSGGPVESAGRYAAEPYDDTRYIVRVLPSPQALEAMADRARHLEEERLAEEWVLARLSALARRAMPELELAVRATARWDRAFAGASLALELGMSRPRLDSGALRLEAARFVPCADECERLGLSYSPLSAEFGAGAVVLFGSNMGGKTVVLKTLLFFQLVAQAGLFVPAGRFETRVYDRVEYVGELSGERLAGLSGFGLEVWRLIEAGTAGAAYADEAGGHRSAGALVAFDELARTTGSHEAEALLSAVVESYAGGGDGRDRAFFATHFRGVARIPGVEYRRMRGLDRAAAEAALGGLGRTAGDGVATDGVATDDEALAERLAGINKCMRYEVEPDDGSGAESDALAIAAFLGLDPAIVGRARYYLTKDGV